MKSAIVFFALFFIGACQSDKPVPPPVATTAPLPNLATPAVADTSAGIAPTRAEIAQNALLSEQFKQKKERLDRIFNRLWTVYQGQFPFLKPEFELEDNKSVSAEYRPNEGGKPVIVVGLRAYDSLLVRLGPKHYESALAFMMGHELSHYIYYMLHPDSLHGMETHRFLEHEAAPYYYGPQKSKEEEASADRGGALNASLAGFAMPPGIFKKLIRVLYEAYGLDSNVEGRHYPPRSEREKTAENTEKMLFELRELYRWAPPLSAAGAYGAVAAMYDTLSRYYPGKEIYNNAGVNYLLAELFEAKNYAYVLPIESDPESRLLHYDENIDKGSLGTLAIEHLEQAIRLDSAYLSARLNLLCAYAFRNNTTAAKKQFDQIVKQTGEVPQNKVYAAASLALALAQKDSAQMRALSANLAYPEPLRQMAAHNLSVLQNKWHKKQNTRYPRSIGCEQGRMETLPLISGYTFAFQVAPSAFSVRHKKSGQVVQLQQIANSPSAPTFAQALKVPGTNVFYLGSEQMVALPQSQTVFLFDAGGRLKHSYRYCRNK